MLYLAYFIDAPVPNVRAETIQALQTLSALVDLRSDARATVFAGPVNIGRQTWLDQYGLPDNPRLDIRPFYPLPDQRVDRRRILDDLFRQHDGPNLAMSRGEAGTSLASVLPPNVPFILEMHRPNMATMDPPGWRAFARPSRAIRYLRARRLERFALRRADAVAWLTPGVRDTLTKRYRYRPDNEAVLFSGVSLLKAPQDRPRPDDPDAFDVIYVGKLAERKGLAVLIQALAALGNGRACIVGGSDTEVATYRGLADSLGLGPDRIVFTGRVDPADLGRWYQRARVGVCPLPGSGCPIAKHYTSPMKVLEMMARGLPIVASDLPSTRDILTDGENALLVPPDSPDALAEAIRRLLDDPGLGGQLSQRALDEVEHYAWPRRAERLLGIVDRMLASR
jgi:glycosyltransferase involved in cell wall biosynthesis